MPNPESMRASGVPYRELGRTGEQVSAVGLGGWHLGLRQVDEQLSLRIVRGAIDQGITFMDNSWDYNDGASEIRMGKALRDGYGHRPGSRLPDRGRLGAGGPGVQAQSLAARSARAGGRARGDGRGTADRVGDGQRPPSIPHSSRHRSDVLAPSPGAPCWPRM